MKGLIVSKSIAAQTPNPGQAGLLQQSSRECGAEADPAPTVRDYESELSRIRTRGANEARFGHEQWGFIRGLPVGFGDVPDVLKLVGLRELAQQPLRHLLDRGVEPQPAARR